MAKVKNDAGQPEIQQPAGGAKGSYQPSTGRCSTWRSQLASEIEEKSPSKLGLVNRSICAWAPRAKSKMADKVRIGVDAIPKSNSQENCKNAVAGVFGCNICSRSYQRQKDLNKHLRKEHLDEWVLRKHAEANEKSAGNYQCAICDERFIKMKAL